MTKPKPFPLGKELRYTLTNYHQGGNWWIAAGNLRLDENDSGSEWYPSPWARFIWVSPGYVITWNVKNPGTGEMIFRQRIGCVLSRLGWEGKSGEVRKLLCNYLREYKRLPAPSELRKYILHNSTHEQLLQDMNEIESYSTLRTFLGVDHLLWDMMPRKSMKSIQIKPPYGWKNSIIEAIAWRLEMPVKGRFVLRLETTSSFMPPPKRPRGRPRKP